MKKQKRNNEDNRGVAIYARKSRITNKGASIGVQFKQCAEYAKRELQLDDDYSFMEYEDKGLRVTIPTVPISSGCSTILKWVKFVRLSATS